MKLPRRIKRCAYCLATLFFGTLLLIPGCGGDTNSHDNMPIKHIVIIMQENRSFDSYFGTYPGAEGIPAGVCVPNPAGGCVAPYHDANDVNMEGPHNYNDTLQDVDGGKMDGFIRQAGHTQIMGYHDARELPNYWNYAQNFVLHDHMFEPNGGWSLDAHLALVSAWSASCTSDDPFSCVNDLGSYLVSPFKPSKPFAWTDLTYLLHKHSISWGYYVYEGTEPDTDDGSPGTSGALQGPATPSFWNPLPDFTTVQQDGEVKNVQTISNFYTAAQKGTLPAVCWVIPNGAVSEHAPSKISVGQSYVTGLVNAIMQGPNWKDTAIFIAWDDWGGFYDHVLPPAIDQTGYGIRVPSLVISPYARKGYVDKQTLSFDAYAKFIEDIFLKGQRLDPATDGRPDPRPDVRENSLLLGDLRRDFDFSQSPRPPLILSANPPPGPASQPPH